MLIWFLGYLNYRRSWKNSLKVPIHLSTSCLRRHRASLSQKYFSSSGSLLRLSSIRLRAFLLKTACYRVCGRLRSPSSALYVLPLRIFVRSRSRNRAAPLLLCQLVCPDKHTAEINRGTEQLSTAAFLENEEQTREFEPENDTKAIYINDVMAKAQAYVFVFFS